MTDYRYDVCPKCGNEWVKMTTKSERIHCECPSCEMRCDKYPHGQVAYIYFDQCNSIRWPNAPHCVFATQKDVNSDLSYTTLPVLPYDVSFDRIRKLLVFS